MKLVNNRRVVLASLIGFFWVASTSIVLADVNDYEFRLEQQEVKKGDGVTISVRLVDKKTGKTIPDAVIFARRIDMAPDGMAMMEAPLEILPSTEPGVYLFRTNLTMAGGWQLSLGAKIQGEEGTVENRLVLKVLP